MPDEEPLCATCRHERGWHFVGAELAAIQGLPVTAARAARTDCNRPMCRCQAYVEPVAPVVKDLFA